MSEQLSKIISQLTSEITPPYLHNKKEFTPGRSPIYYSGPYWDESEVETILNSVLAGKWLSSGEAVHRFEIQFSKKFKQAQSVMVNSGSSANLVMVGAIKKVLNWRDGDEIIVSPVGFPTTIAPIYQHNLQPVFADIEFKTLNFDLEEVEKKITPKTKAIFISPVLANPPDFNKLLDLKNKYNLELILDNCDSLGSQWEGKYLNEYVIASSCSFYPAHHICTAEGGMVSSNNPHIVKTARSLAWWGRDCYCVGMANLSACGTCGNRFDKWLEEYSGIVDHKYIFTNMGYNLKPLDLQGALGCVQLEKFSEIHKKRRANKQAIDKALKPLADVNTVDELPAAHTSWFGVPIVCKNKKIKDALVSHLEKCKIQTRNYFAGNILIHPAYKHLDDYTKYPHSNRVLDKVFFLGCSPTLTKKMIDYIIKQIQEFFTNHEKN
tara:strand:+ start:3504 stop:4811 length:1308 start_codon:yes stop_codon:yes gene_type:complete